MGDICVTSRNVVKLFFSTLLVGGVATVITAFFARWSDFLAYFSELAVLKILSTIIWMFCLGMVFSVLSQMGFFAYLTVHRFGLGILRSPSLWNGVQIVLILFALFDLVYFRFKAFAEDGEGLLLYVAPAVMILLIALLTAYFKAKQTNKSAFIPAVFFMTVVTIIEWVPALRTDDPRWVYLMIFPLIVCNIYQLLILHKLNEKSEQERKERLQEKKIKTTPKKKTAKAKS